MKSIVVFDGHSRYYWTKNAYL